MTTFNASLHEVRQVQHRARPCEAKARTATNCQRAGNTGAYLAHDSLARNYSRDAFDLAGCVARRENT